MRETILKWMYERIDESTSAIDLAQKACKEFPNVIGIDTFVWDDAETLWEIRHLIDSDKKYQLLKELGKVND